MEVFLFEYVTCGGEVPDDIVVEGLGMFKSLYNGFSKVSKVISFVDENYRDIFPEMPEEEDLFWAVRDFSERADFSLIVAPEDDDLLLNLTKLVERNSENLGSSSEGVKIASNKWRLYKKLEGKVNMPLTSKEVLDPPFLLKPEQSCGGEGIVLIRNHAEVNMEGMIAQEFIEGKHLSVSLLVGDDLKVLSVNEQILEDFAYRGAVTPARIGEEEKEMVVKAAKKAVEEIKGLHGYVGVDIILSESPYVIEINPRLTTPSILFERVYGFNLGELIIRNHTGKEIKLKKAGKRFGLRKTSSKEGEVFIEYGGRALTLIPL